MLPDNVNSGHLPTAIARTHAFLPTYALTIQQHGDETLKRLPFHSYSLNASSKTKSTDRLLGGLYSNERF